MTADERHGQGGEPRPGDPAGGPGPESPQPPAAQPPESGSLATATPQGAAPPAQSFAIKRGAGRVIGLYLLSFGLYHFYWFYVTRKELSRELATDDDAGLQTAGLLVPILNWFIIYWLWRDINRCRTWVGLSEFSIPLYLILSIIGLSPVFFALVVTHLNEYWDWRSGGQATNAPVTRNEKIVVALGALLWVLSVLAFVIAIIVAVASS